MEFANDLRELQQPAQTHIDLNEFTIPDENALFFRAKQKELLEQYDAARMFLSEIDNQDWEHWFAETNNKIANNYFKLVFQSRFYEAALFFYNSVVDISWTVCYVAAEFACSQNGRRLSVEGIPTLESAVEKLRALEGNVTSPTAEETPFAYLKSLSSEFSNPINQTIEFWTEFAKTDIRHTYNFCKHKGHPIYNEIEELNNTRVMDLRVGVYGKEESVITDVRDVQMSISLKDAIDNLLNFDNEKLFPYVKRLIETLETIVEPSEMITY